MLMCVEDVSEMQGAVWTKRSYTSELVINVKLGLITTFSNSMLFTKTKITT